MPCAYKLYIQHITLSSTYILYAQHITLYIPYIYIILYYTCNTILYYICNTIRTSCNIYTISTIHYAYKTILFILYNTICTIGKVIAYGEFGLDYDRLHYSNKETQLYAFKSQLNFISTHLLSYKLPLFLHNRNTGEDFYNILYEYKHIFEYTSGVVHSFDGTLTDLNHIINLNLYIGMYVLYTIYIVYMCM